jgi:hypothetical protein
VVQSDRTCFHGRHTVAGTPPYAPPPVDFAGYTLPKIYRKGVFPSSQHPSQAC